MLPGPVVQHTAQQPAMSSIRCIEHWQKSYGTRVLARHAANFEGKVQQTQTDCARVQAALLRRTLLHGLNTSHKSQFGVPCPLPRALSLLNLSGDRVMLYSSGDELLRVAISSLVDPWHLKRHMDALDALLNWGKEHAERNVCFLCAGVMPWQEGIGSAYFEVRSVINVDGQLKDGHRFISSDLIGVREGSQSLEPVGSAVGVREVRALANDANAVSVDRDAAELQEDLQTDAHCSGGASAAEQSRLLRRMTEGLRSDRQKLIDELAAQKASECERMQHAEAKAEARAQEQVVQAQRVSDMCRKKMADAEERITSAVKKSYESQKRLGDAQREAAVASLTLKATVETAEKAKKAAVAASQSATRQNHELLRKLDDAKAELREYKINDQTQTAKEISRLTAERDSTAASEKEARATIQKLGAVLDRCDNEKATMKMQIRDLTSKLADLQREAELDRSRISEVGKSTAREVERIRSEQSAKSKECTSLKQHVKSLEKDLAAALARQPSTSHASVAVGTSAAVNASTDTHTVASTQTDPQPEPDEPVAVHEVCRQAHLALHRLIKTAQAPHSAYQPGFHNHAWAPAFRPANFVPAHSLHSPVAPPPPPHHYPSLSVAVAPRQHAHQ